MPSRSRPWRCCCSSNEGFALHTGDTRRHERPLLCGDAKGGVGGAVAGIATLALDDLEEEALLDRLAVELEELSVLVAIVEDIVGAQILNDFAREIEAGDEVIIV